MLHVFVLCRLVVYLFVDYLCQLLTIMQYLAIYLLSLCAFFELVSVKVNCVSVICTS